MEASHKLSFQTRKYSAMDIIQEILNTEDEIFYANSREDQQALEDRISSLYKELAGKFDNSVIALKMMIAEIQKRKDFKRRIVDELTGKIQRAEKRLNSFKAYLAHIGKMNPTFFQGDNYKGWIVKTKSVVVDDPDNLPEEYIRKKTIIEPDKQAILYDLKSGTNIPGARLEEGESLRWR